MSDEDGEQLSQIIQPRWDRLNEQTVEVFQHSFDEANPKVKDKFVVGFNVIRYSDRPEPQALELATAHQKLLALLGNKKAEAGGYEGGLGIYVGETNAGTFIYFALELGKDSNRILDTRDELVEEANQIIKSTGGNKFIPSIG